LLYSSWVTVADNVKRIRERIHTAAARAGRDASEITLMAVSKTFPATAICEAYAAGLRVFGENRVQEFAGKADEVRALPRVNGQRALLDARAEQLHREALEEADARFHLIGHLQSNKAAKAVELFDAVDSVDSLRLAAKLDAAAKEAGKTLDILLEVNIGKEAAKSGLPPDVKDQEFQQLLQQAPQFPNLRIRGLMCIPPHTDDPNGARPYFCKVRELREQIASVKPPKVEMTTLSMGMSHDFEVAIEEGSTCVRLGTAIFGERPKV
jgi:pyridoxal phosphate enzyme (YggS family)